MLRYKTILIPVLIIICLIVLLIKCNNDIRELKYKNNKLLYKAENETVLKEKYFTLLTIKTKYENKNVDGEIILTDNKSSFSNKFRNIISSDDLVLCIPEFSCHDCIEKVVSSLQNNLDNINRIVVLSVLYDKDSPKRFFQKYGISNKKWQIYNVESKYFWNISNNKILLFQVDNKNRFRNFIILDGEFDTILETYLESNL